MPITVCARGLLMTLCCFTCWPMVARADDPIVIHRTRTIRNPEQLQLERFERIEFPNRLQVLSDQIKLAKAELQSIERRIAEYERFQRFQTNAFFVDVENLRLVRLELDMKLKRMKRERLLLQYYGREEIRLRKQQLSNSPAALSQIY